LAGNLLRAFGYSTQLVSLHSYHPCFTVAPAEPLAARPIASPVARLEAHSRNVVTNLWHERVTLQTFQCHLLIRLDGNHTRRDLLEELRPIARTYRVPASDEGEFDQMELERQLALMAQAALLVG
jgi:hypothetical protein